jgi:D-alanyl-D-alanine carboxypeptidase/D-alanyl-D-alanine-endopeptidase (penicillin-binding protein 4)
VQPDSPAAGHVFAKTGTGVQLDAAHSGLFMTEKALGGYINSAKGRRLAFVMMVEDGLIDRIEDIGEVNQELGKIAEIIWSGRR